jgi:hypothetical protein
MDVSQARLPVNWLGQLIHPRFKLKRRLEYMEGVERTYTALSGDEMMQEDHPSRVEVQQVHYAPPPRVYAKQLYPTVTNFAQQHETYEPSRPFFHFRQTHPPPQQSPSPVFQVAQQPPPTAQQQQPQGAPVSAALLAMAEKEERARRPAPRKPQPLRKAQPARHGNGLIPIPIPIPTSVYANKRARKDA